MSNPYKEGDRVKVTFEAEVTHADPYSEGFDFKTVGLSSEHSIWAAELVSENVTVERLGPAYWPPQVGDLWDAEGDTFFIASGKFVSGYDTVYVRQSDRMSWDSALLLKGRAGLKLTYRKGLTV